MIWLFACVDGADSGETGEPTDDLTGDLSGDLAGEAACAQLRFLAANADWGYAFDVDLAVYDAAVGGTSIAGTFDATGVAAPGLGTSEVCSSIEEFPQPEHWAAESGTLDVTFTPLHAWPPDGEWVYDGTILGTVDVVATDIVLAPRGEESETLTIASATWSTAYSRVDLPAR